MSNVGFALCVFGLLALCVSTPITKSEEHNIYQCSIVPGVEKQPLLNETVKVEGGFLQVKKKTIVFPASGVNTKRITCISILDQDEDDHGATVSILKGGLGDYSIEIEFVSQFSEGINSKIELYADAEAVAEVPDDGH